MKRKKKRAIDVVLYVITFKWLFIGLVLFYKKCVSPFLPSVCAYYPSCSTYMLESIEKYGIIKGIARGGFRLLRCNPWTKGGFDPVPDNPKGDMKWLF